MTAARFASSTSRPAMTLLWLDAHAPSWLARGTRIEVGLALRAIHLGDRAGHADLSLEQHPEETHARPGMRGELPPLVALVAGEEDEPAIIELLEENDPGDRVSRGVERGERHRGGLGMLRGDGVLQPTVELNDRRRVHVTLVQARPRVFGPDRGQNRASSAGSVVRTGDMACAFAAPSI